MNAVCVSDDIIGRLLLGHAVYCAKSINKRPAVYPDYFAVAEESAYDA